jgi:VanZ family protein
VCCHRTAALRDRSGQELVKAIAYAPATVWAGFLLFLSGRTWDVGPVRWYPPDKVVHFILYAVLGALLAWGWARASRRPAWPWLVAAGLAVGLADEWRQRFTPGRSSDLYDWITDAAAVMFAFVVVRAALLRFAAPRASG